MNSLCNFSALLLFNSMYIFKIKFVINSPSYLRSSHCKMILKHKAYKLKIFSIRLFNPSIKYVSLTMIVTQLRFVVSVIVKSHHHYAQLIKSSPSTGQKENFVGASGKMQNFGSRYKSNIILISNY